MSILFRYVLKEFLTPLFYCLTGFLSIYVIFELFDSVNRICVENKPPFWKIVSFFLGYISPYLQWIIPAALLLATLYTLWNFCRHSEITAMRASGIGFGVIVSPLFVTAAIMVILVAVINEFYAPHAAEQAKAFRDARFKEITSEIRENVPYYNRAANRVWRVNEMDMANPKILNGVLISFDRPDGSSEYDITCRKAEYLDGMWWLFYPQYQYFERLDNPIENPKPELSKLVIRAFPDLDETPENFVLMNKPWEYYSVRNMVSYLKDNPNLDKKEVASKRYDIHSRLAVPFSCLIITLFAIPAGVATSRQSVFKGVIIAISMFMSFYAANIGCMILVKNALMPVILGAWLPNLVFFVTGLILFYRHR